MMARRFEMIARLSRLTPPLVLVLAAGAMLWPHPPADANPAETRPPRAAATAAAPDQLEVYPEAIELSSLEDHQGVVVRTRRADGVTEDELRAATQATIV